MSDRFDRLRDDQLTLADIGALISEEAAVKRPCPEMLELLHKRLGEMLEREEEE
jgi:hypothetical protein